MRTLKTRLIPLLLVAATGCVAGDDGDPTPDDSEATLSNYDDLMNGAPSNDTLPDDNKADAVYPPLFTELLATQSPVKSQGSRGVCSIFAATALMEHLYLKAGASNPDFSEQYLQWSVKVLGGDYTWTEGSNADANLAAVVEFGIPEEAAWPYESFPWGTAQDPACGGEEGSRPVKCFTNGDPPESARTAQQYKLPSKKYLNTNSIKAHMTTKKTAVIVGLDFFYQSWNHRRSKLPVNSEYWRQGYVLYPNPTDIEESRKQRAGHAIELVGWDDNLEVPIVDAEGKQVIGADGKPVVEKGFYIFKNSWGTGGFGIANPYGPGYGYLSMKYVKQYGSAVAAELPTVAPPPPPPGGGDEHYEATPNASIPDDDSAGVSSEIVVPTDGAIGELVVNVNITHTYVGDLTVRLVNGPKSVTLHAGTGGSDDNLVKAYTVSDWNGLDRNGTWRLEVVDGAAQDTGTLNSWSLDIR